MKKIKCKHEKLTIWRTLNLYHLSEVSVLVNEDKYPEVNVNYEDSNEWDIRNFNKISVSCPLCGKEWNGKKNENFPLWLQEILDQEESHFKSL